MHILLTREELAAYHNNNWYKDSILAYEPNTKDLSRIEKARWFRVNRLHKRMNELSEQSWNQFRLLWEKGYQSIIGERIRDGKKEWTIFKLDHRHDYGISVSRDTFDMDNDFKITDFSYIDHDLINLYFTNDIIHEKLRSLIYNINRYFFDCVKEQYKKEFYNKISLVNLVLTVNGRLYVFSRNNDFKPIILPEYEGFDYLTYKI